MADGKWIPGLKIDTPVVDAAHQVLSVRLKVIQHYLPHAAEKPEEDVEYVHQLRVGSRRALRGAGYLRRLPTGQSSQTHQTAIEKDPPRRRRRPRLGCLSGNTANLVGATSGE